MRLEIHDGGLDFDLDTSRLDIDLEKAQQMLDRQVLVDSTVYVPFQQGALRSSGHIVEDGLIEWNTPYAHYMYEGIVYADPKLGVSGLYSDTYGWWSHRGVTKVPTERHMNYSASNTGDHWFERAKAERKEVWRKVAGRCMR